MNGYFGLLIGDYSFTVLNIGLRGFLFSNCIFAIKVISGKCEVELPVMSAFSS